MHSYDAESRQIRHIRTGVSDTSYSYDGDGRRVKKTDAGGTTVFVYDAMGKLVAEYTTASVQGSGTSYITQDHLGSTRLVTDAAGGVKARHDYLPYGEEISAGIGSRTSGQGYVADNVRQKFTGKERDSESGLDYFLARYYSSAQGRFTSIDPKISSGKLEKPSTWNRYTYVWCNPLIAIDPDGKEGIVVSGQPGPHQNRIHFLVNGLDRAMKIASGYAKAKTGEKVTWFIYNEGGKGGYKESDIAKYKSDAGKAGINVQVVSDQQVIVDYVNTKTGSGQWRGNDLVTNFTYIGHATPGDLDIGYVSGGLIDSSKSRELAIEDFDPNAFSSNSVANMVGGCNTAIAPGGLVFESSIAEQMADKVGGKVLASNVTVVYTGGRVTDQELVRTNKGSIVEIPGRGGKKP